MDIDFDDLDGPSKAPVAKTGKFAPKNSKFKPVAKPKKEPELPVPLSEPNSVVVPKVELDDSKPPLPVDLVNSKDEIKQLSHIVSTSQEANGSVQMDIDGTEMDVDNEQEPSDADPVVREIDVYFTSSVDADSKLYVLQYPLRQIWRPYELDDRCDKVRVKPETAEVEVEMSVEVGSQNYDEKADEDKVMPKQVLSSSWKPPAANSYAVGILVGNELHLNPVHAVVQLRPSMQHFKRQDPSKKMNGTHDDDMDIKSEKAKKQPKKQSKPPEAVNEQIEGAREQWISLKYHGASSDLSGTYVRKMAEQSASQIQFTMSPSDYIDSLCPATANNKRRNTGPSRSSLLKLPLDERFKTWLLEGPPLNRFNALKHLAPNESDEDILTVLQKYGQLVQGLWVAKSSLKCKGDQEKDILPRNYVLLQLSRNIIFHKSQLPTPSRLRETTHNILDQFTAKRESCSDWKFKEIPDDSFIKQYPDIVEKQKGIWDSLEPQIMAFLFRNPKQNVGDRRPASNLKSTNDGPPKGVVSPPARTVMLDEAREVLPKALQKVFQMYKVCSFSQIQQRLRDAAVNENANRKGTREARLAAAAAEVPKEELQKTLNEVAINIHGSFVLKSSPDYPQYDELRNVVINLFLVQGPKGKLKKASINEAAKLQLKREMTNAEYSKVLNELCVSQNSAWVLKSGDNPS